ncbi:MAG: hypothetical protein H6581_07575 [Bacteroidia bacterium]|nr:hypothetical protein [Bacteroidia bacterium]
MTISYIDQETRSLCNSIVTPSKPFTSEEIEEIRAHLADLKAAQNLYDAPVDYLIINGVENDDSSLHLAMDIGRVQIRCRIINKLSYPNPEEVTRLLITKIFIPELEKTSNFKRIDL